MKYLLFGIMITLAYSCKSLKYSTDTFIGDKGISGWDFTGDANWDINGDVLEGSDGLGYAVTNGEYGNFVLEAEFNPNAQMNSGIFIRCPEKEFSATDCYEINIADNHENQEYRTGAIVTHGKPLKMLNSIDKWNSYKISARGNRIKVWLNGKKTADITDSKSARGYIGLQVNGDGAIQFRNVKIAAL